MPRMPGRGFASDAARRAFYYFLRKGGRKAAKGVVQAGFLDTTKGAARKIGSIIDDARGAARSARESFVGTAAERAMEEYTNRYGRAMESTASSDTAEQGRVLAETAKRVFEGKTPEDAGGLIGWLRRRHRAAQAKYIKSRSPIRAAGSSLMYGTAETATELANTVLQSGIKHMATLPGVKQARYVLEVVQNTAASKLTKDWRRHMNVLREAIKFPEKTGKSGRKAPGIIVRKLVEINDKMNNAAKATRAFIAKASEDKDNPFVSTVAKARMEDAKKLTTVLDSKVKILMSKVKRFDKDYKIANNMNQRLAVIKKHADINDRIHELMRQRDDVWNNALYDVDTAYREAGVYDTKISGLRKSQQRLNAIIDVRGPSQQIEGIREAASRLTTKSKQAMDVATSPARAALNEKKTAGKAAITKIKSALGIKSEFGGARQGATFDDEIAKAQKELSKVEHSLNNPSPQHIRLLEGLKAREDALTEAYNRKPRPTEAELDRLRDDVRNFKTSQLDAFVNPIKAEQTRLTKSLMGLKATKTKSARSDRLIIRPLIDEAAPTRKVKNEKTGLYEDVTNYRKVRVDNKSVLEEDIAKIKEQTKASTSDNVRMTDEEAKLAEEHARARFATAHAFYTKELGGTRKPLLPTVVVGAGMVGAGAYTLKQTRDRIRIYQKARAQERMNQQLRDRIDALLRVQYPDMERWEREATVDERVRQHRMFTQKAEQQQQLIDIYKGLFDAHTAGGDIGRIPSVASINTPQEINTKLAVVKANKRMLGKVIVKKPKKKKK